MERKEGIRKAVTAAMAALFLSMSFALCVSVETEALEFVDNTSLDTPWTSTFRPLDSAWDSTGTQCIVVGNDLSGIQPSAWHYNEPTNSWTPITEGSDPAVTAVHTVKNQDSGIIYATIQAAINAASAGDTLRVWAGTYSENILIEKFLTIIGNGSANTIISGWGATSDVVTIRADSVTFSGFNVSSTSSGPVGIMLQNVQNCIIEDNTVWGNTEGIILQGCVDCIVRDNEIKNNGLGVGIEDSGLTTSLVGGTYSGGEADFGALFKVDPSGLNYNLLRDEFAPMRPDGRNPYSNNLIRDSVDPSTFYGMTQEGGIYDRGIIFRIVAGDYYVMHHFTGGPTDGRSPHGSLLQIGQYLYGMTYEGGPNNYGTIFRIGTDGSDFQLIHSFTDYWAEGARPFGSLITTDGMTLYGMTREGCNPYGCGSVFKIQTNGTGFTTLHGFDYDMEGGYPQGDLVWDGGASYMYGMTPDGGPQGYGTIFRINILTSAVDVIWSFESGNPLNGRRPYGSLIIESGVLYGMTCYGGANDIGLIFSLIPTPLTFTPLHSFASDGTEGYNPRGGLVSDGTFLYGMTENGGPSWGGVIFKMDKLGASYSILFGFNGGADGTNPIGTPMLSGTNLYGMVPYGGAPPNYFGFVFSTGTSGGTLTHLHDFDAAPQEGYLPTGRMIQYSSTSQLYGMTRNGGPEDNGAIFRMNTDGSNFEFIYDFAYATGARPYGSLIQIGAQLYGVTTTGGPGNQGTVFRINADGTGYTNLHSFNWNDGSNPRGELVWDGATWLYGMTCDGGAYSFGTVFQVSTDGTVFNTLWDFEFNPSNGRNPYGSLILDGGYLYGMTRSGGIYDSGTIFKIYNDGTMFQVIHSFSGTGGSDPYGSLTLFDGYLYGLTQYGGDQGYGVIFRITPMGNDYERMHSFTWSIGGYPSGSFVADGGMLYTMIGQGGTYGYGGILQFNPLTYEVSPLHYFTGYPNDGGNANLNELTIITQPAQTSSANFVYHNNFIGNAQQAQDDSPVNFWYVPLPPGGNYWSDYAGVDDVPAGGGDGIGDTPYAIPGAAGNSDTYPLMIFDGWALPYTTFRNVIWDDVYDRFWLCGDVSSTSESELYYITAANPTVMVPIPTGIPQSFTAIASDTLGNILIGGNNLQYLYYYVPSTQMGYPVSESSTGTMFGWNITGMTYNPNDSRFYIVGSVLNEDKAVAFATAAGPLTGSPSYCYVDTSGLLNSPGIGTLNSISWNPDRDYALAVGDGVYRLDEWWGTGNPLCWSIIQEPQAGITYNDISWDSDGYIEAGIVGREGLSGKYWRYYHTNPTLLDGYTSINPFSNYWTCAMKPPSSPKWLIIPTSGEIPRINLEEKDESGIITFASEYPQIFSVEISKQSDVTHPDLMDTQVDADSTYTFFIESNYTVGGFDQWNDLAISLCAWYDGNTVGMASSPGSWASDVYRTKQFNVTYDPVTNSASLVYPSPVPPAGEEFSIDSFWEDPVGHGADGHTHYLYINVTFGPQTWAATGPSTPSTGSWSKIRALNDLNTWDLQVHMYDSGSTGNYNLTYMEFGIKEFAEIASSGSPTGTAPPGTTNFHLSTPCTIYYATNTEHYVTVSISNLYFGGDPLETKFIPATKLQTENLHPLATSVTSDISSQTYFAAAGTPLYVWGLSTLVPEGPPYHGTQMAGPGNTDYTGAITPPFELTTIDWWIDVPVSITSGIYIGTITITIMN